MRAWLCLFAVTCGVAERGHSFRFCCVIVLEDLWKHRNMDMAATIGLTNDVRGEPRGADAMA